MAYFNNCDLIEVSLFGNLDFIMSLEYIYFIERSNYYGLTLT